MARLLARGVSAAWCGVPLSVAVLCLLAATTAVGSAQAEKPGAAPTGVSVGVVDMVRVLRESDQWRDSVEERSGMMDKMRRTTAAQTRQVQILRNEYENLAPDTEERSAKGAGLERALQELQQTQADMEGEVARQHGAAVRRLFGDLARVAAASAQERGIQIVLRKQNLALTSADAAEQSLQMATAEVLYTDPALDITDDVLERLNAEYGGPIEDK